MSHEVRHRCRTAVRRREEQEHFDRPGRGPLDSVNFITSHDGFTLADLVSYRKRHNQANGEDNRDGHRHNYSSHHGVEGETDRAAVNALRRRHRTNLLATLLLSQGVPMLVAGDEMGRTQQGNNNAYCQDNEISWLNWNLNQEDIELINFVQYLIQLTKKHPSFRRRNFFQGHSIKNIKDIIWLNSDGQEMSDEQWQHDFARSLGTYLAGSGINERNAHGHQITDDDFLILLNAHHEQIPFQFPDFIGDQTWQVLIDTFSTSMPFVAQQYHSGESYPLQGRSLVLLTHVREQNR